MRIVVGLRIVVAVAAAVASGCKGKGRPARDRAPGGEATRDASPVGSGSAAAPAGEPLDPSLRAVDDCPAALTGEEKGVARTVRDGCVVAVEGDYAIEGALVIEAGAVLAFEPGAALHVGKSGPARLLVAGTGDKPAMFTASDRRPGTWKGVRLYPGAARSRLVGLTIEHAEVALTVEAPAVTVEASTFRDSKSTSVRIADDVTFAGFARNTFAEVGGISLSLPAAAFGGIAADNQVPAETAIELRGGAVRTSATWPGFRAVVRVLGEVAIDGDVGARTTLTIAAGGVYQFSPEAGLAVGRTADAALTVAGTSASPVRFGPVPEAAPGAWRGGLVAFGHGSVTLEYAVIERAGAVDGVVRALGGTLAIERTAFLANAVAMTLDDDARLARFDQNQLSGNRARAVVLAPVHLGGLGPSNAWNGQEVGVRAGAVDADATWVKQRDGRVVLDGPIDIDGGTVTIGAGTQLVFGATGALRVGAHARAALVVRGSAEHPVVLEGARPVASAWGGVVLGPHSVDSALAHLIVRGAAGPCVDIQGAVVAIDGLVGQRCKQAAVRWDCAAKVTAKDVAAEAGTPKPALFPTRC